MAWTRPLEDVIDDVGVRDAVHVTGYLSDRALGDAYRYATVFAFPSRFEGFALPVVEALGFGLPVLTTRTTAIPEVTRASPPTSTIRSMRPPWPTASRRCSTIRPRSGPPRTR